jgi:hypothetical protein
MTTYCSGCRISNAFLLNPGPSSASRRQSSASFDSVYDYKEAELSKCESMQTQGPYRPKMTRICCILEGSMTTYCSGCRISNAFLLNPGPSSASRRHSTHCTYCTHCTRLYSPTRLYSLLRTSDNPASVQTEIWNSRRR